MKKHLISLLLLLLSLLPLHSQYMIINKQNAMIYSCSQVEDLNKRTLELVKSKADRKLVTDSLYIYNFFHIQTTKKLGKKDFLDKNIFKNVLFLPLYENYKKKSYPSSYSIVLNKDKEYIGMAWIKHFTTAKNSSVLIQTWTLPVIMQLEKLNVECIFSIMNFPNRGSILFGKTYANELIVFHSKRFNPPIVSTIEDFVNNYWDEYVW